uniref:DUF1754-domain-containing protein n=1 Tax=Cyclophora tenuis TaxID=216820 RepID=A0A7S1D8Y5_CYCTE|mmetsp:Transcript_25502/g.43372  ORF Transcript_25502/g.43372 Transcript_25502/m.43372 type:complete len:114 (+) Transcript_25502:116-457(+)
MAPTAFIGGALSFKGDKKKPKKKNRKSRHKSKEAKRDGAVKEGKTTEIVAEADDDEMTDAERRALKFKEDRELQELEAAAQKSHRDRVEEFNEKLSKLTEHNDIPRVSAAGNG